jgi:hypothetical protein
LLFGGEAVVPLRPRRTTNIGLEQIIPTEQYSFVQYTRIMDEFYGQQCWCRYAEAFRWWRGGGPPCTTPPVAVGVICTDPMWNRGEVEKEYCSRKIDFETSI